MLITLLHVHTITTYNVSMKCVICGGNRTDSRSLTCYSSVCQKMYRHEYMELYKNNRREQKKRTVRLVKQTRYFRNKEKLVALLMAGASKPEMCRRLRIKMKVLNLRLCGRA